MVDSIPARLRGCAPLLLVLSLFFSTSVSLFPRAAHATSLAVASDGPGSSSYFNLARKDCLGTARNTQSKVWFTLADGVLSDLYYPYEDNSNVKSLQFVVTDGKSFTDLQTRDTTYTTQLVDNRSLDCRVTTTAKNGKYRLVTEYITDPNRNSVVIRTLFTPLKGKVGDYQLYLRYDPTLNGNGGGGTPNGGADNAVTDTSLQQQIPMAYDINTKSQAVNRDYAVPVYSALEASSPFIQVSNGFVGAQSDGLTQLDASHKLTGVYDQALNGNVVQTAQIDLQHPEFTFALGFGTKQAEAVQTGRASLLTPFTTLRNAYIQGWHDYDSKLIDPRDRPKDVSASQWNTLKDEYYLNANVVKSTEDKTFAGAIGAGLASPWGQAVAANDPQNAYFGSYREVFARDLYETWTGLIAAGDTKTARDTVDFLFLRQQQADGSIPRNSLLNGKTAPDSFGAQLDESSYPILMADQMHITDKNFYEKHIKPAANFVISHGPAFGVERWEEQQGYSPSTISAEIAGLVAAADIARINHDSDSENLWLGVADNYQRSIEKWAVTTNGPLAKHPYYIRLSKTGDPNAAISYNLGNGGPTLDQRQVIDAGFLELVRLGLKPANDTHITESLPIVDTTIKAETKSGPGWLRYNGDGYGDESKTGHPWPPTNQGNGHLWPLLNAERGEYELLRNNSTYSIQLLETMRDFGSGVGLLPEQDWELPDLAASPFGTDPTTASIGFKNGKPAGSAAPLTWSTASFVRLMRDISTNQVLDRPGITYDRYVRHQQGSTKLILTAPADTSSVTGSPVTVSGTSKSGNKMYVAGTNTDNKSQTSIVTTTAKADGTFSVKLPVTGGTTVINVVARSANGATANEERTVVFDFTPGTKLLDITDPNNDDNGPGNYAYPTAADFHPGAYDIQRFQVFDNGTNIIFKLQTRDLSPTFGSPFGAQLVDVYIHDPNAAAGDTSTAVAYPQRNYAITQSAAWSKALEVQGFGSRYVDAKGNALGTITSSGNAISRFISFSVPASSLGHPKTGWGFTVTLAGQDGFSPDQARAFTATPGGYSFGVCAAASSDPRCTVDPATVPKVLDTLTPTGVSQSDELDYTKHNPVTLQDGVIP